MVSSRSNLSNVEEWSLWSEQVLLIRNLQRVIVQLLTEEEMLRVVQLGFNLALERVAPHNDDCVFQKVHSLRLDQGGQLVATNVKHRQLH